MFSLTSSNHFLLCRDSADMRKSFDGLSGIVINRLQGNPQSGEVYIFINKPRNKMKLLHWEEGGFTLYYKRLEQGTFELPVFDKQTRVITWPQLAMIVSGISLRSIQWRKRYVTCKVEGHYEQKSIKNC